ncbi:UPF0488 protein CG14286 [Coccinella septempunctata]|uniref:UPF0488 protein CG14286 n=1 Tax=Coccinella septempunctata TaxID=41139 RepID=UPI001D06D4E2|nr:UPF0488 protein CG14286 [Coccinella septempunctata]
MNRPQPKLIMTPEMEEKFESELLWCIQQLQSALKSGKLSKKQSDSTLKSLNVLMGNSSIVKKRQTMRVLFGDYRAKMIDEEKKLSKCHLKLTVEPMQPHKNSKCLKKHTQLNDTTECKLAKNIPEIIIYGPQQETEPNSRFKFLPSDNSFRFNFS